MEEKKAELAVKWSVEGEAVVAAEGPVAGMVVVAAGAGARERGREHQWWLRGRERWSGGGSTNGAAAGDVSNEVGGGGVDGVEAMRAPEEAVGVEGGGRDA